jgi:hypothetical protein
MGVWERFSVTDSSHAFSRRRFLSVNAKLAAFAALPGVLSRERLALPQQSPILDGLRARWSADVANRPFSATITWQAFAAKNG